MCEYADLVYSSHVVLIIHINWGLGLGLLVHILSQ